MCVCWKGGGLGIVKVSVILSIFCSRYSGYVALRSKNDKTQKNIMSTCNIKGQLNLVY